MPDYSREKALGGRVAGVDEVGRGPLAGPVMAAAVVLDPARIPEGLNDSKQLSIKKREVLYPLILEMAEVSVGTASVEEIDEINILQASLLAMRRAVAGLSDLSHVLVDGRMIPQGLPCPATGIILRDGRRVGRGSSAGSGRP